MSVLILKNIATEGPGTIENFLKTRDVPFKIVEVSSGWQIPNIDSFNSLIVMGGPMGVYEMDKYPFLKKEAELIEKAITKDKKVFGICLGAQMIAYCLGAKVYAGNEKEIGWCDVNVTIDGARDPVFSALNEPASSNIRVLQWHGDTFDLPNNAVRLASSRLYPNQAFRYGSRCYAIQFHIEATPNMVEEWFSDMSELSEIMAETKRLYPRYKLKADLFYKSFFGQP